PDALLQLLQIVSGVPVGIVYQPLQHIILGDRLEPRGTKGRSLLHRDTYRWNRLASWVKVEITTNTSTIHCIVVLLMMACDSRRSMRSRGACSTFSRHFSS